MVQKTRYLLFIFLLSSLALGVGEAARVAAIPDISTANAGWEEIGVGSATGGGISNNAGGSWSPSLAVSPEGPIIAWDDDSNGDWEIYVRRWNGAAWIEMGAGSASGGGISDNSGSSENPSLAISAEGPIIAWHDDSSGDWEIYVRRWNGAAWIEMGAGSASGGGISEDEEGSWSPSLAVSPDGPIVAWYNGYGSGSEIYVRRWDGAAWVEMGAGSASGGGVSNNGGLSRSPALAISLYLGPIVAWDDDGNGDYEIYVRRWNGTDWVEMGAGSASGGGISDNNGWSVSSSLVDSPYGPIVAWEDDSGSSWKIYVRRWDGVAWVEMGVESATGGGISGSGSSWNPSLAVSLDGPIIAWEDGASSDEEIYVRRWSGTAWVEMGVGSASGGGISHSAGTPWLPSVAVSPDGPIIAWNDNGSGDHEIYVRRSPQFKSFTPTILYQPLLCFPGPGEQEPNNTQAEANGPLCRGQAYHGRPDDFYDVFYFDTHAMGPIAIELNDFAAGGGQLGLLSAAFAPIAYDVTPGDGFRIDRPGEAAGRYYVVVHAAAPDVGAGAYALRATFATR